jgi:hypothetical protein
MPIPPPLEDASLVFSKWNGLKNTVNPERLAPEDLAVGINIDLDDVGQPHRRRGYQQVATGDFHSLFNAEDETVYGVKNNALGIINKDYSFTSLRTGLNSDPTAGMSPLSYAQVGTNIYFSSAQDNGIIDTVGVKVLPWGQGQDIFLSPVLNPTANLPAIRGKLVGPPPLARFITYYNGRIFLAQGNTVWVTELYSYSLVDRTRGYYMFEAEVTMLGTVGDGVYVGTKEGLWFLTGTHKEGMPRKRVIDTGVIPGTMVYIPAELGNPPQVGLDVDSEMQVSIAFMTSNGFCVAEDGGAAYNLTESKFFFPFAARGASMFRRQDGMNTFVTVLDSEGGPVNNARIGDYVEAEIIRFNAKWVTTSDSVNIGDSFIATIIKH